MDSGYLIEQGNTFKEMEGYVFLELQRRSDTDHRYKIAIHNVNMLCKYQHKILKSCKASAIRDLRDDLIQPFHSTDEKMRCREDTRQRKRVVIGNTLLNPDHMITRINWCFALSCIQGVLRNSEV